MTAMKLIPLKAMGTRADILVCVASLLALRASGVEVLSPAPGAVAFLGADGGLQVTYALAAPAAIKVDVFGFADPNGWPNVRMGPGAYTAQGELHGSVTLYDLSLGAVRIRLRALTPDGRDAVGEQSVEYFVAPDAFFGEIYASSWWLQEIIKREANRCCAESSSATCLAPDASAFFCESAEAAIARFPAAVEGCEREGDGGSGRADCLSAGMQSAHSTASTFLAHPTQTCVKAGLQSLEGAADDTAVLGMLNGYDFERLFPFVESLRATGYRGAVHLIHRSSSPVSERE